MKFTTTLAVASLLSAAFVAATPIPYEDEVEVAVRDFDDFEVEARDFDDFEVDAREFDDFDVDAREFDVSTTFPLLCSKPMMLNCIDRMRTCSTSAAVWAKHSGKPPRTPQTSPYRRRTTSEPRVEDVSTAQASSLGTSTDYTVAQCLTNRHHSSGAKKPAARPRPAGGVRPVRVPSPVKAPGKSKTNWKGAWDAAKGKAPAAKPKKSRPVLSKPAKHVARPGGHAGKPVKMPIIRKSHTRFDRYAADIRNILRMRDSSIFIYCILADLLHL